MDAINLVMLSTMLFSVGFFAEIVGLRRVTSGEKHSPATSYLYAALFLWIMSSLTIRYSGYSLLKLAMILHFSIQLIHHLLDDRANPFLLQMIDLTLAASLYWVAALAYVPLPVIHAVLIGVVSLFALVQYFQFRRSDSKERLELSIIALMATALLMASPKQLTLFSGTLVFLIYQGWDLYRIARRERTMLSGLHLRLDDLENRFHRQVEHEARRRTTRMVDQVEEIRESAQKDPLTKAFNRHGINSEINALINDPSVKIFSIALLDLDRFKEINDTLGHLMGDESLKFLASYIMRKNRRTDLLGRFGGDEFILVYPNLNAPEAVKTMNRLRRELEQFSEPKFTISVGVATFPFDGRTVNDLLAVADQGLYQSKESGKNRVSYSGRVPILEELRDA